MEVIVVYPNIDRIKFKLLDSIYTKEEYRLLYSKLPFGMLKTALKAKLSETISNIHVSLGMTRRFRFLSEFLCRNDSSSYDLIYQRPLVKVPFFINSKYEEELISMGWRLELNK
jgi:hypothetical protein